MLYKKCHNNYNTVIRNAKRDFLTKGLMKRLWRHLKATFSRSGSSPINMLWPANTPSAAKSSAVMVNSHFVNGVNTINNLFCNLHTTLDVIITVTSTFSFQ